MITSGEEFLSAEALTNIALYDIPFPAKRYVFYDSQITVIIVTVDYEKLGKQIQIFMSNE